MMYEFVILMTVLTPSGYASDSERFSVDAKSQREATDICSDYADMMVFDTQNAKERVAMAECVRREK
jgi:hypothetical protein